MSADATPVLVRVTRGGRTESEHRGAVAVVRPDGGVLAHAGDAGLVSALRSAAKPFQLLACVVSGAADEFGFTEAELAVMAGSHAGTPAHVDAVRSALAKAGLDESHLRCGAHPPFDPRSAEALVRAGQAPSSLHNNCSGKHAAMLAAAKHLVAPLDGYLDIDHPVQRLIRDHLAWACGIDGQQIAAAVDGCSAPTFFVPLAGAARAFARLAAAEPSALDPREAALARIRRAMTTWPEMVSGAGRLDTELMKAEPRVCAKGGAEGIQACGAWIDGTPAGVAVKIADGGGRAAGPALLETLRQLLWDGKIPVALARLRRPEMTNHRGTAVGAIEPEVKLARA